MNLGLGTGFDVEEGLIALPGTPERWIWAFTCPETGCSCRAAVVVSTSGDRATVRERGLRVAEAWRGGGRHAAAALELTGAVGFAVDLDTLDVFPPVGEARLDLAEHPEVKSITDRFDDDVLDAIARLWHRGKGELPPSAASEGAAKIEIEGWRPGDMVVWDDAQAPLRGDTYVFGERIFEAVELYCVEADCDCREAIVDFSPVEPRGAPHPGHVEIDGASARLCPAHERHRQRLTELWNAYCGRHRDHEERFARRSTVMHRLAGRIVAARARPKVGRNEPCPCGSGKKHKKCCVPSRARSGAVSAVLPWRTGVSIAMLA